MASLCRSFIPTAHRYGGESENRTLSKSSDYISHVNTCRQKAAARCAGKKSGQLAVAGPMFAQKRPPAQPGPICKILVLQMDLELTTATICVH
jgi:hypothetical protein